jgi:hypothetical protein
MNAEGLRHLLSNAGVDETVTDSVMTTVNAYLARPDTGPVALFFRKRETRTQDENTVHVRVFDLPLW